MHTPFSPRARCSWWVIWSLAAVLTTGSCLQAADPDSLPRFTEEREAAALFFVKRNLPELAPYLELIKKNNATMYQHQVREIFHLSEMLADLGHEPRLYDLELAIWKTENMSHLLVARLTTCTDEERPALEKQLFDLAKQLVDLDIQILEMKADQLDRELGEVRDELSRVRENKDGHAKQHFEKLMEKVRKRKK